MVSFLLPGEKIILKNKCDCKWKSSESSGNEMREIILTDKRLIYVYPEDKGKNESIISREISRIKNFYIEKSFFGGEPRLVIILTANEESTDLEYKISKLPNIYEWETKLKKIKEYDQKSHSIEWAIIKLLKSQERTTFDEVFNISREWLLLVYDSKVINDSLHVERILTEIIADLVANNKAEGFIDKDKKQFVNKIAYQQKREVIQYHIATSIEFGQDGTISLKCPNCGASKPQKDRSSEVVCEYCHSTYVVPKKVLDLI